MTGIRICDDGPQEVGIGNTGSLVFRSCDTLFSLLSVVEKLSHEKVLNLIGNSILLESAPMTSMLEISGAYHWVVRKIWGWLICGRSGRRALPARHIDSIEIFGHLGEHSRFQAAVGEAGISILISNQSKIRSKSCFSSANLESAFHNLP